MGGKSRDSKITEHSEREGGRGGGKGRGGERIVKILRAEVEELGCKGMSGRGKPRSWGSSG